MCMSMHAPNVLWITRPLPLIKLFVCACVCERPLYKHTWIKCSEQWGACECLGLFRHNKDIIMQTASGKFWYEVCFVHLRLLGFAWRLLYVCTSTSSPTLWLRSCSPRGLQVGALSQGRVPGSWRGRHSGSHHEELKEKAADIRTTEVTEELDTFLQTSLSYRWSKRKTLFGTQGNFLTAMPQVATGKD